MNKIIILLALTLAFVFGCSSKGSFTDERDGKTYSTVKIGKQVWIAENLNIEVEGSRCYDNNPENCDKYGRLYNWKMARNACPSGWHLPDSTEWQILIDFAGGKDFAGKKLKSTSGWRDHEGKSGNGEDKFGFAAMPGIGYDGTWWSSSSYWWNSSDNSSAYCIDMVFYGDSVYITRAGKNNVFYSIRCIQDNKAKQTKVAYTTLTDERDGKKYKTVKIGEQTWFAENLNIEVDGSKCYDNDPANCDKYGRLYSWKTSMKICPNGWHLPDTNEWKVLVDFTGGKDVAGDLLKATSGWNDNGNGEDKFGFSAIPGGVYGGGFSSDESSDEKFLYTGKAGFLWSATENDATSAYFMYMYYDDDKAEVDRHCYKDWILDGLLSVRCVKD